MNYRYTIVDTDTLKAYAFCTSRKAAAAQRATLAGYGCSTVRVRTPRAIRRILKADTGA